ncbi:MAG: CPBP family intramembrane metalloprotease [Candidatus Thermoplasmatota archaeon]|nr:CPBP family intramembrane metalloprotease [Candidatus Thermoplasmatota archaeon]
MDFTPKKPLHLFALLLFFLTILLLIISPILSFIGYFPTTEDIQLTEGVILLSSLTAIFLLIGTPLIWYAFVNNFNPSQLLTHLKLSTKNMSQTIFWAILAVIIMYAILFIIGITLTLINYKTNEITNIQDIAGNLSITSILFVTIFQSSSEEFFFRGFLFDKIQTQSTQRIAILGTALLFGIAHLSYGKIYPAIMTMIFGIILAVIVIKSQNLLSAILAHILYNGTSFAIFIIVQSYNIQAIIL